jgi:hypothetical protein
MYPRFFLSILFTLLFKVAFGQDLKPLSDCPNFNKFTKKGFNEELLYYADSIYPRGLIIFEKSKMQELNDFNKITELLKYEKETSFTLERETKSFFDDTKYQYYQQYYKGILVDGGGYSKNIPTDTDPCLAVLAFSANIAYDINLDVVPNISESKLKAILSESFGLESDSINSKLVISCNMFNDCSYRLAWRVEYESKGFKISWIDAKTGKILKTIDGDSYIDAPTQIYGKRYLEDSKENNTTFLRSPDKSIIAYDMSKFSSCSIDNSYFTDKLIPKTTDSEWKTSVASEAVYQAFFVTTETKKIYKSIGIDFKKIHVGVGCPEENAKVISPSSMNNAFITIGQANNNSFALFDVIGHELSPYLLR